MIKGIIVEGCDCSGKSTLIRTIKTTLSRAGWETADLGHKDVESQFDRYLNKYLSADKIIFDRGHFSEAVYSQAWRGGSSFNGWELNFLNEYVLKNFIVIFAYTLPEILKQRYLDRAYDQTILYDELEDIQQKFSQLLNHPNVIQYNSLDHNALNVVCAQIFKQLGMHDLCSEISRKPALITARKKKDFILIEGANGSGKSTLSKLLKISMVGWGVKTLDYKPVSPFERYLKEYVLGQEIIFDRGHFSEIVYGDIFRRGKHFSPEELNLLNAYVKERGIVIFCNSPVNILQQRVIETDYPKHIHESRIEQVCSRFKSVLDESGIEYYCVDTSKPLEVKNVVNEVSKEIAGISYAVMGWDSPISQVCK